MNSEKKTIEHGTFTIEREYAASPERVFSAWGDPVKKRRWFVEGEGWTIASYELDFREHGWERSRFRFGDGPEMTNDAVFLAIEKNRRIVSSYAMTMAGKIFSVSLGTLELEPTETGTRMRYTEQAAFFEGADGVENRRQGCEELFQKLAEEVEGK